jgi:serine/threonine-protein kinase HipA
MSELIAYLCGRRAGRLIRKDNGNLQFRYDSGYRGPPVSQSMPVQAEAHPHSLCRAVFGGLLAEGDARETLARNLGVSAGNDYALLKSLGGDCAGALVLLDAGVELPITPSLRPLGDQELDALLRDLPQRPLAADERDGVRLSLAGAQPKVPVVQLDGGAFALPLNAAAPTTHIIKPEPSRFPGLVDNEAFCMELARGVELPTASVSRHASSSGLPYLLVERYDRDLTADPIRRLHQEDVCQATGHPSDRKYQAEGGPGVAETVALLRASSAVPAQDLPTFWRALVFNWLIGNCDGHAKNFSLLYDAGVPTLAPLYDLVSTVVYPELTTRLAMTLDGARAIEEVTPDAWNVLARETGFSARFARTATEALIERVADESGRLAVEPRHDNPTSQQIRESILERAL